MIHTQLYLMSVSILGEQEKNNDCSDDSLTWCVLSTQTDRQTDIRIYCLSLVSQQPRWDLSLGISQSNIRATKKCSFSLCYFIYLWLFPESNKISKASNTGAFAYGLYLLTTRYHFTRRQRFNSNTYWSLHVKWPIFFPDFNQIWIRRTEFRNSPHQQISLKYMWKPRYYKGMNGQTPRSQ